MPDPIKEKIVSPYVALGETDSAFITIEETLTRMLGQKAFEKNKNELTVFQSQLITMRRTLMAMYSARYAAFEAAQLKKLTAPPAPAAQ